MHILVIEKIALKPPCIIEDLRPLFHRVDGGFHVLDSD